MVISLRPVSQKKEAHKTPFFFGNNSKAEGFVHMFQGRTMNLKCIYLVDGEMLLCMPMEMMIDDPNLNRK